MADTIRRRIGRQDEFTDDQLEPASDAFRRHRLRSRARRAWGGLADAELSEDLAVSAGELKRALAHRFFGRAWAPLEAVSPILRRRRVRFVDLSAEIAAAKVLLQGLVTPELLAAE
jgi:hypothetical protein